MNVFIVEAFSFSVWEPKRTRALTNMEELASKNELSHAELSAVVCLVTNLSYKWPCAFSQLSGLPNRFCRALAQAVSHRPFTAEAGL